MFAGMWSAAPVNGPGGMTGGCDAPLLLCVTAVPPTAHRHHPAAAAAPKSIIKHAICPDVLHQVTVKIGCIVLFLI